INFFFAAVTKEKKHLDIPKSAPKVIKWIMKRCFKRNPQNRPLFSDIIERLEIYKEKFLDDLTEDDEGTIRDDEDDEDDDDEEDEDEDETEDESEDSSYFHQTDDFDVQEVGYSDWANPEDRSRDLSATISEQ